MFLEWILQGNFSDCQCLRNMGNSRKSQNFSMFSFLLNFKTMFFGFAIRNASMNEFVVLFDRQQYDHIPINLKRRGQHLRGVFFQSYLVFSSSVIADFRISLEPSEIALQKYMTSFPRSDFVAQNSHFSWIWVEKIVILPLIPEFLHQNSAFYSIKIAYWESASKTELNDVYLCLLQALSFFSSHILFKKVGKTEIAWRRQRYRSFGSFFDADSQYAIFIE